MASETRIEKEIVEETRKLYQQGKSIRYINKTFKISNAKEIIQQLIKDNKIDIILRNKARAYKKSKKRIENFSDETIKKIKDMYELNCSQKKIAKEVGIEYYKINDIIEALKTIGLIDEGKRNEASEEEHKLNKISIKERYEAGENKTTIIKEEHIPYLNYETIIAEMQQQGLIDEEKRTEAINQKQEARKMRVRELYEAGLSKTRIRQELHMTGITINNYIEIMKAEGSLDEEKRERNIENNIEKKLQKEKKQTDSELKKRVAIAYKKGVYRVKIAKQENVSYGTIKSIIDKMIEEGVIEPRRNIDDDKRLRIKEYYEAGVTKTGIAKKEHISYTTFYNLIIEMKSNGEINESNRENALNLLGDLREQLRNDDKIDLKRVESYVNNYVCAREFNEAIIFLDCVKEVKYVPNKKGRKVKCMPEEQIDGIVCIQDAIKRRINREKAVEMLKENEPIEEIVKSSNLTEGEVIELKEKIKEMQNKREQEVEIA